MKKYSYWIGFGLSLIFLGFFFRKIDFDSVWKTFKSVEYLYTIPFILVNLSTIWIRAKRWRYLLAPIKQIKIGPLFHATAIGFMANNILPARIGEFIRAYVLGNKEQISKTASFATIVVERLFDGFAILLIFFLVILFMPFPADRSQVFTQHHIKMAGFFSFLLYVVALGVLLALRFHREKANRLIEFFFGFLPPRFSGKVIKKIESFVAGLEILQRANDILVIAGYSIGLWVVTGFSYYFLFLAFHFDLSILAAFFLLVVLIFGVAMPSAPGYIGTFHLACAGGMIFLGIEANLAKSFALLVWFVGFIPIVLLGLFSLWKEGMSLGQLKKTDP
jgi:glycosyltransferase 2 family protein